MCMHVHLHVCTHGHGHLYKQTHLLCTLHVSVNTQVCAGLLGVSAHAHVCHVCAYVSVTVQLGGRSGRSLAGAVNKPQDGVRSCCAFHTLEGARRYLRISSWAIWRLAVSWGMAARVPVPRPPCPRDTVPSPPRPSLCAQALSSSGRAVPACHARLPPASLGTSAPVTAELLHLGGSGLTGWKVWALCSRLPLGSPGTPLLCPVLAR